MKGSNTKVYLSGTYSACPMHKRVYTDPVNSEEIANSNSWEECAASCKAKTSCLNWEWRDAGHSSPNTCLLNEGFTKTVDNYYAISGNRECQGKISRQDNRKNLPSGPGSWVTCQDENPFSGVSSWDISEVEDYLLFQTSNPSSSTNSLPFRLIFCMSPNVLKHADLNGAGGRASVSSTTRKVLRWAPSISYSYHVLHKYP